MSTYVLVPGMRTGGWTWKEVERCLRAEGHEVYRCTLTGLGERRHLASPDIGIETHIMDVVNVLVYEQMTGVVLVGSSYAGKVVASVADRVPERIAHAVYMDSGLPRDGESGLEEYPVLKPQVAAALAGDGFIPVAPNGDPRSTPHPVKTLTDKIKLSGRGAKVPSTYILCTQKPPEMLRLQDIFIARARENGWRVVELDCVHEASRRCPEQLARLLLEIAEA